MNMLLRSGVAVFTPALLATSIAQASQSTDMETVIVTGSKIQTTIADSATTMWVIDQDDLQKQVNAGADLKAALGRLIPGFDFSSGSRTNYSQNLRGRTALVMIDGVSLNSTREISRQFDSIDPFNIARIEVLSGATALFGAGASGGIINIITKKGQSGDAQFETRIGAASGFNGSEDLTKQAAVAVSGGSDKIAGRLSIAYEGRGASYDSDGNMILPDITQTDLQFNQAIDVMGNLEMNIDENQRLSLTAQFYDSQQDTEYGTYLGPNLAALFGFSEYVEVRKGLSLDDQPGTQRRFINAQYNHDDVLGHALLAQLYYRSESLSFFPFPTIATVNSSAYYMYGASVQDTDIVGGKIMLQKELGDVTLNYGAEIASEKFSAKQKMYDVATALASGGMTFKSTRELQRYPDITTTNGALFTQANWRLNDSWLVNGGLRYQNTSYDVSDFVDVTSQDLVAAGLIPSAEAIEGGKSSSDAWLFNLGSVYSINQSSQVWANFSQGFSLPDPAKFYGRGTYSYATGSGVIVDSVSVSNTPLEGVKTDSLELGWRQANSTYSAQVAAYYSVSDKTLKINSTDLSVEVDNEESRVYGIEGQFDYFFTQDVYAGLQAHLLNNEEKNDGSWQKRDVQYASPSSAVVRVGYDNLDYGVELFVQALADYKDAENDKLEGYTTAGLSAFYALPVGQVNLGVENLFNTSYQTVWSQRAQAIYGTTYEAMLDFQGLGRTVSLSYSAEF
ncbi:TonB-dependent receptor [Vibrio sp. SCSIO 43136]|uniref:TonB-dependent receptor n=1 Tax=Vibrio sp. SCSIO 43136 TaxID=2819101 RepID=UPI0020752F6E|nr:TonB-dependent receptor [Vibrio sp. SCSIO 43136]USD67618.1 TonB-dependent receptor [Vibrio sp. SCSIO 43136]